MLDVGELAFGSVCGWIAILIAIPRSRKHFAMWSMIFLASAIANFVLMTTYVGLAIGVLGGFWAHLLFLGVIVNSTRS